MVAKNDSHAMSLEDLRELLMRSVPPADTRPAGWMRCACTVISNQSDLLRNLILLDTTGYTSRAIARLLQMAILVGYQAKSDGFALHETGDLEADPYLSDAFVAELRVIIQEYATRWETRGEVR